MSTCFTVRVNKKDIPKNRDLSVIKMASLGGCRVHRSKIDKARSRKGRQAERNRKGLKSYLG